MIRAVSRVAIVVMLAVAPLVAACASALDTDAIDRLIARAMDRWEVPAVAVAVVDRHGLLLSRVHGARDVERDLAATPRTLFAIGSITKSFTVVALARLAEAGALDWDAPAGRYLPELRLRRLPASRPVSVRDLVTHRSGMHRHDALWYLHAHTRAELIRRLGHLQPFAPPGQSFQYSNLMVAAAGAVAARISGRSWEALVERGILRPAGMRDTRLTLSDFLAAPDRAVGYFPGDDGRIRIPPRDTTAIAPAAAVYSSLRDMTRWVRTLLAGGTIDGHRVLGAAASEELLAHRITIPDIGKFREFGRTSHGMGFYLTSYRGRRLARHPGVIDGYAALMSFMPALGLGVVVLTNRSGDNPVPAIVTYAIYDRLLGLDPVSWIDRFPSARQARESRQSMKRALNIVARPPSRQAHAGVYRHPAYGSIRVTSDGAAGLTGRLHGITFTLRYVGDDDWEVAETSWPFRAGLRVRFRRGPGGRIVSLATPLADGPTYRHNPGDLEFVRLSPGTPDPSSVKDRIDRTGGEDAQHHR